MTENVNDKKDPVTQEGIPNFGDHLLIRIARAHSDPRMSGPDGGAFGFCQEDYPESGTLGMFAETELEAAILFLEALYP